EVVVSPGVGGGDRVAVAVHRRRPMQRRAAARAGQRPDRADQSQGRQLLGLSGDGAEPGALQQSGRLGWAERALVGARRAGVGGQRAGGLDGGDGAWVACACGGRGSSAPASRTRRRQPSGSACPSTGASASGDAAAAWRRAWASTRWLSPGGSPYGAGPLG